MEEKVGKWQMWEVLPVFPSFSPPSSDPCASYRFFVLPSSGTSVKHMFFFFILDTGCLYLLNCQNLHRSLIFFFQINTNNIFVVYWEHYLFVQNLPEWIERNNFKKQLQCLGSPCLCPPKHSDADDKPITSCMWQECTWEYKERSPQPTTTTMWMWMLFLKFLH